MTKEASRVEGSLRVAYQGVEGAFSHMACGLFCPRHAPLACRTFDEALRTVEEGRADVGLIPIENTLGGRVAEIHQLLSETTLFIVGEGFMPIEHHLLGVQIPPTPYTTPPERCACEITNSSNKPQHHRFEPPRATS